MARRPAPACLRHLVSLAAAATWQLLDEGIHLAEPRHKILGHDLHLPLQVQAGRGQQGGRLWAGREGGETAGIVRAC